jgi:NADH:flavin oxidoreductase / NADH oxidase family
MTVTPGTPYQAIPTPDKLKPLFEPIKLGPYQLETRVVYGPLTRCRAEGTVPVDISVQYYAGAASCHLRVTLCRVLYACADITHVPAWLPALAHLHK